jgi:hypothetical protein
MNPAATDQAQTVTLILQGLAYLASLPGADASPVERSPGSDAQDLAPALTALIQALQAHAPARERVVGPRPR